MSLVSTPACEWNRVKSGGTTSTRWRGPRLVERLEQTLAQIVHRQLCLRGTAFEIQHKFRSNYTTSIGYGNVGEWVALLGREPHFHFPEIMN